MSISVVGPKATTLPSVLGGNDQLYGLTLVCVSRGLFVQELGDGMVRIDGIKDFDLVTIDVVKLLVSEGCDVEDYPFYFVIDDVKALCPLSPSDQVDPEGNTIPQETWETWGLIEEVTNKPKKIGDKWYRNSQYGYRGDYVKASVWVPLLVAGTVGVITPAEYDAINPQPETP